MSNLKNETRKTVSLAPTKKTFYDLTENKMIIDNTNRTAIEALQKIKSE
jgi:hypothetical protein